MLQPQQQTAPHSSARFRRDWLRQHFPRKHGVYIEEPEDYASILPRTPLVLVTNECNRAPETWGALPRRSDVRGRFQRFMFDIQDGTSSRLESVLTTGRRTPAFRALDQNSTMAERLNYFSRQFTAASRRTHEELRRLGLLAARVQRYRRRAVSPQLTPTVTAQLQARRSRQVRRITLAPAATAQQAVSAINPHELRNKSPRSSRYLERQGLIDFCRG
jgi:hypothetical protein